MSVLPSKSRHLLYAFSSRGNGADRIQRFAWGDMQLPRSTMEDFNMKLLWDQTNLIISM